MRMSSREVKLRLDLEKFAELAKADFEFVRETRYLTGVIKLGLPDHTVGLEFKDGVMLDIRYDPPTDEVCKIVIKASAEQWDSLLAEKPKPFYQCLQSANVKHGLELSSTNETFAYLPALNRMTTLMRQSVTTEAVA
jgi:hypothetical protein